MLGTGAHPCRRLLAAPGLRQRVVHHLQVLQVPLAGRGWLRRAPPLGTLLLRAAWLGRRRRPGPGLVSVDDLVHSILLLLLRRPALHTGPAARLCLP